MITESQIKLVKEQTFLDMRVKISNALVENGILETRNDIAGFWKFDPMGNHVWVSFYELLEDIRD